LKQTALRRTPPRRPVRHKLSDVCSTINRLVNIACASAKIDTLLVRQQYRDHYERPVLHVILQSGPGSLKSTILEQIGQKHNVTPYSYVTYAAMIGSIDPLTGELIPGLVWPSRKRPLLLDEFRTGERGDTGSIDVLLGVLETGLYKRKVAQRTRPFEERDGDLYYRVRDGEIEVKTRFPCIIATMKNLDKARSVKYPALIQRAIPIRFALQPEEIDQILEGKPFYEYQDYDVDQTVLISRRESRSILEIARQFRIGHPEFQVVFARAVGDLTRMTAVLGGIDVWLCRLVCFLKDGYRIDQALQLVGREDDGNGR
jgi:hypothetical protein